VKGSDGAFHLVYELKLTNAASLPWKLSSVDVFEEGNEKTPLLSYSKDQVASRMEILGLKKATTSLDPGQTAIVWVHLTLSAEQKMPSSLVHRLSVSSPRISMKETGGLTKVLNDTPITLAPPLRGGRWVAADGCCDAHRHVRAILPVAGKLFTSQRFAIDWEEVDEGNHIYVGDPRKVESYLCYGQDVIAVADGKVITVVEGLPNQIPGKLPENLAPAQADGNHVVLELAPGKYALFAHMIKGSIKVKEGEMVKRGQLLGNVGNSGNTSAPHLHFHVMNSPSTFGSEGLSYLMDRFELKGRVPNTESFDEAEMKGTPLPILPSPQPGVHHNELPLDLSLVDFP
jgi:hypothetical protein